MKTHGLHGTPAYMSWVRMKQRCLDKNCRDYKTYGAKGVVVCERWLAFENFYADMGDRPEKLTLERINGNYGYDPENCRWASRRDQSLNRKITKWLTFNGRTMCMTDWAREFGLTKARLSQRLKAGWPIADAIVTPTGKQPPHMGFL